MAAQLQTLLDSYPKELMAFFGNTTDMFSPAGYLGIEFFSYMPIVLGIFAVLAGSGLVAADEESGTLDLLLAHPVSRAQFFAGRVLAFVAGTLAIMLLLWGGLKIGADMSEELKITAEEMARPFVSVLAQCLLFGGLGLFLSMVLPSRRMAAMVTGVVLIGSFLINGLAELNDELKNVVRYLPLHYYQGGEAINGLNVSWVVGLLAVAALLVFLAWWRFERRDIRVGGEGGWRIALPWRRMAPRAG